MIVCSEYEKFLNDFRNGREKKKLASSYTMNVLLMKRKKLEFDLLNYTIYLLMYIDFLSEFRQKTIEEKSKPFFLTKYSIKRTKEIEIHSSSTSAKRMIDSQRKSNQDKRKISFQSISKLPCIFKDNNSRYSFIHSRYRIKGEKKH